MPEYVLETERLILRPPFGFETLKKIIREEIMNKIRDWLYVGKYSQTRQRDLLDSTGITAMLQLAEEITYPDMESLFLYFEDGVVMPLERIKAGIAFIREQKAQGKVLLVACGAGISRSTIFAMAALMEEENLELFEAYREIYRRYRGARPHHELCISLSEYYGKPLDLLEAHDGLYQVRKEVDGEAQV